MIVFTITQFDLRNVEIYKWLYGLWDSPLLMTVNSLVVLGESSLVADPVTLWCDAVSTVLASSAVQVFVMSNHCYEIWICWKTVAELVSRMLKILQHWDAENSLWSINLEWFQHCIYPIGIQRKLNPLYTMFFLRSD